MPSKGKKKDIGEAGDCPIMGIAPQINREKRNHQTGTREAVAHWCPMVQREPTIKKTKSGTKGWRWPGTIKKTKRTKNIGLDTSPATRKKKKHSISLAKKRTFGPGTLPRGRLWWEPIKTEKKIP